MTEGAQLQPAYVLHRRAYSNTSLLLECFTFTMGRLPVIAAGAKRPGSGRSALLQPFVPLLLSWSGKGEIKTLRNCEAAAAPHRLHGRALYCGFYVNELLLRLLQREAPHGELFGIYAETLGRLAEERPLEPLLRFFELDLLDQLGLALILDKSAEDDAPLIPEARYHYVAEVGPVRCNGSERTAVHGRTLLALAQRLSLDIDGTREARSLMRAVLQHYLGDRPLKSRELFQSGIKP